MGQHAVDVLGAGRPLGQGGGAGHVVDVEPLVTPALGEAGQVTVLVLSTVIALGAGREQALGELCQLTEGTTVRPYLGHCLAQQRTGDNEAELLHHLGNTKLN